MFSQSHAFAFQCPLICNCFCAFWIVLVTIRIAFRNTNPNTRFFLALFEEETNSEIAVSVKLWLCSVHSLFGPCDFLVHRGVFLVIIQALTSTWAIPTVWTSLINDFQNCNNLFIGQVFPQLLDKQNFVRVSMSLTPDNNVRFVCLIWRYCHWWHPLKWRCAFVYWILAHHANVQTYPTERWCPHCGKYQQVRQKECD